MKNRKSRNLSNDLEYISDGYKQKFYTENKSKMTLNYIYNFNLSTINQQNNYM
jgi:hypothetical protein